jgi:hypothetical protein
MFSHLMACQARSQESWRRGMRFVNTAKDAYIVSGLSKQLYTLPKNPATMLEINLAEI